MCKCTKSHTHVYLWGSALSQVFKQAGNGWWFGELQSRGKQRQRGWFPADKVELLHKKEGDSGPPSAVTSSVAVSSGQTTQPTVPNVLGAQRARSVSRLNLREVSSFQIQASMELGCAPIREVSSFQRVLCTEVELGPDLYTLYLSSTLTHMHPHTHAHAHAHAHAHTHAHTHTYTAPH